MPKFVGALCAAAVSAALLCAGSVPALATAPPPVSSPSASPSSSSTAAVTEASASPSAPLAEATATPEAGETLPPVASQTPPQTVREPIASSTDSRSADPAKQPAAKGPAQRRSAVSGPGAADPFVARILARTNSLRAQTGAGPLTINGSIAAGSQEWAAKLNGQINNDTLDMSKLHRPDAGASILPGGYDMYSEVIGINGTPEQIVDWWMNSPAHKAALMNKRATDLGLGYVRTTQSGWGGMTVVVGNLAGYPQSREDQPLPAPVAAINSGDIAAIDGAGNLYVYPSAKGGDLWNRTYVSTGWGAAKQVDVADYNNDGRQDVITVWRDGRLTASYGQADGKLGAAKQIGSGWGSLDILVTTWQNSTRFPGIVARHRTTGQLFLYPNLDGTRFGKPLLIGVGWGALTLVPADFDGDGRMDLLARNNAGQLLLYRGNGTGHFISETRRVVGVGWGSMTHLAAVPDHTGPGSYGVLARTTTGALLHYPILKNRWGARAQIGSSGWNTLTLGS